MAAGNNNDCLLELDFLGRWSYCYSLPPSTTVAQLKHTILHDFGIDPARLTLKLTRSGTTMEHGHLSLAWYGIRPGEHTWLTVDAAKMSVLATFPDYADMSYFLIVCYEFDSVAEFKRLVVENLWSTGVTEIGPQDLELFCGAGVRCSNPEARLSEYGVGDMDSVDVKTAKLIPGLQRRFTSSSAL